jgi:hypothetical protein
MDPYQRILFEQQVILFQQISILLRNNRLFQIQQQQQQQQQQQEQEQQYGSDHLDSRSNNRGNTVDAKPHWTIAALPIPIVPSPPYYDHRVQFENEPITTDLQQLISGNEFFNVQHSTPRERTILDQEQIPMPLGLNLDVEHVLQLVNEKFASVHHTSTGATATTATAATTTAATTATATTTAATTTAATTAVIHPGDNSLPLSASTLSNGIIDQLTNSLLGSNVNAIMESEQSTLSPNVEPSSMTHRGDAFPVNIISPVSYTPMGSTNEPVQLQSSPQSAPSSAQFQFGTSVLKKKSMGRKRPYSADSANALLSKENNNNNDKEQENMRKRSLSFERNEYEKYEQRKKMAMSNGSQTSPGSISPNAKQRLTTMNNGKGKVTNIYKCFW